MSVILIYLFIFGLFIGSFYNVVALRLCKNESIIFPGSHCVNCNHKLAWYELIPVFSYIALKGKCKRCRIKISIQYPLVELLTGTLFALSYYIYGFSLETISSIILVSVAIIIYITDIKYMVILDEVVIIGGILLLIIRFIQGGIELLSMTLVNGAVIMLIFYIVKLLGDRVFKQESLGWGDVKLAALAGMYLGIKLGIAFLFLGSFLAFPYAVYLSIRRKVGMVPFGPFLVTSLLVLFWNYDLALSFINTLIGV